MKTNVFLFYALEFHPARTNICIISLLSIVNKIGMRSAEPMVDWGFEPHPVASTVEKPVSFKAETLE